MEERKEVVTFKGTPLTLIGCEIKLGVQAPSFTVLANDLSEKTLGSFAGKTKLISVVPSLDTPVCELQTKRFNEEATKLSSDIEVLTISMDLPFAQHRFCESYKIDRVQVLSDHRDASFGLAYGVLIKELRLLARSIFIIDKQDTVRYIEIVKEITSHPDYEKALAELGKTGKI
ncbi:MAG: thiol peroxidase [bacterium]|nr:thiol peroxidase [bacterium]